MSADEPISFNSEKNMKDVHAASLVAIIYGACGLIIVPLALIATPDMKQILMPNRPSNIDPIDIIWNLSSSLCSLWWGLQVRKKSEERLTNLTRQLHDSG